MLGALISICVFLITVCGILLLKPENRDSIRNYSEAPAIEERKKVTLKMARFLEENPGIVQQKTLTSLPLSAPSSSASSLQADQTNPNEQSSLTPLVKFSFQGDQLEFKSHDDLNRWIYEKVKEDALGFANQIRISTSGHPELYLETLKKITEINQDPNMIQEVKNLLLDEARALIQNKDGFHQQMTQKALQTYLNLEENRDLGKKIIDDLLNETQEQ